MSDDLDCVKRLSRLIARQPGKLAIIRATHGWPRARIPAGAYIIFEERLVPLNGSLVLVARLAGQDYHYVGRAYRIIQRRQASIRLDDGTFIPPQSFTLRGPVVLVARSGVSQVPGEL